MSDTPETDAILKQFEHILPLDPCEITEVARKLERERDEAVHACHIWQQGHSVIVEDRDYWKVEAEKWRAIANDNRN
jgi:hypothetical protein